MANLEGQGPVPQPVVERVQLENEEIELDLAIAIIEGELEHLEEEEKWLQIQKRQVQLDLARVMQEWRAAHYTTYMRFYNNIRSADTDRREE